MAQGNIELAEGGIFSNPPTTTYQVAASATIIYAGEPVKLSSSEDQVVIKSVDAEPVTTDPTFVGIAAKDSTNDASTAGTVEVFIPLAGQVYRCKAKTASLISTQALYDAYLNERVVFDLTSTTFTVDLASSGATYGLVVVPNDIKKYPGMVAFEIRRSVLEKN